MNTPISLENTIEIKKIELVDFSIIQPKKQLTEKTPFYFDIEIVHQAYMDNKLITVLISIGIFAEKLEKYLGKLTASCTYSIADIDDFFEKNTGEYNLPDEVVLFINSTSYSTARGMMFSQFRGTFLHNAALPIIDNKIFLERK